MESKFLELAKSCSSVNEATRFIEEQINLQVDVFKSSREEAYQMIMTQLEILNEDKELPPCFEMLISSFTDSRKAKFLSIVPVKPNLQKIVINKCFGGFGLSPKAVARMAELQDRPCYFFYYDFETKSYYSKSLEELTDNSKRSWGWSAYDIPDLSVLPSQDNWHEKTDEERIACNQEWNSHEIEKRDIPRNNAYLIQVVEELGDEASGDCAELRIIEIPADVNWSIHEYDGMETVEEVHRSWG